VHARAGAGSPNVTFGLKFLTLNLIVDGAVRFLGKGGHHETPIGEYQWTNLKNTKARLLFLPLLSPRRCFASTDPIIAEPWIGIAERTIR